MTVTLRRAALGRGPPRARRLPGVIAVEPQRIVAGADPRGPSAAVPRHHRRARRRRGFSASSTATAARCALPPPGVVLSRDAGRACSASRRATRHDRGARRQPAGARASRSPAWSTTSLGLSAYMDIGALHRADARGRRASPARSCCRPARRPRCLRELKRTPAVAGAGFKRAVLAELPRHDGREHEPAIFINLLFAGDHRVRRRLQRGAHLALRTQPRAGQPARARLHARRDLAHPAGRARAADADGAAGRRLVRLRSGGGSSCDRSTARSTASRSSCRAGRGVGLPRHHRPRRSSRA